MSDNRMGSTETVACCSNGFVVPWYRLVLGKVHKMSKLDQLMKEIESFSDTTFGNPTERNELGPLVKLKDELDELIAKTDDTHEWADCMLLLLDAARRKGITPEQLFGYCLEKLEINRTRTWVKTGNKYSHAK